MKQYPPITDEAVLQLFENYPKNVKMTLLTLRALILDTAVTLPETGGIVETVKWNEPSYLPVKPRVGTTIRLNWTPHKPSQYGIYLNCKTSLVDSVKTLYGDTFQFVGNRGLLLDLNAPMPKEALVDCIIMALTYHIRKKGRTHLI